MFVKRLPDSEIVRNFLNRVFFNILPPKNSIEIEYLNEFYPEIFLDSSNLLEQVKFNNEYKDLCQHVFIEMRDLKTIQLLYKLIEQHQHFVIVPELFCTLDSTLGFEKNFIEETLNFISRNINRFNDVNFIENNVFVFMSAIFKSFLSKPSQATRGYIMIFIQNPMVFINAFVLIIKKMMHIKNDVFSYYNPLNHSNRWISQVDDLYQTCHLMYLFFDKLNTEQVPINEYWMLSVKEALDLDKEGILDASDNVISFCTMAFLNFEKKDREMNPRKLVILLSLNFKELIQPILEYASRWSYLDWTCIIPVLFKNGNFDKQLVKQILENSDDYRNVIGDGEEKMIHLFIKDYKFYGEEIVTLLIMEHVNKFDLLDLQLIEEIFADQNVNFGIVLLMSSKNIDSMKIVKCWLEGLKKVMIPVDKFESELEYFITEPINNNHKVNFKTTTFEELFCKYTQWILYSLPVETILNSYIKQWWAELLVTGTIQKYNLGLYKVVQANVGLKNFNPRRY